MPLFEMRQVTDEARTSGRHVRVHATSRGCRALSPLRVRRGEDNESCACATPQAAGG